jgi:primosomal replication protein N
VVSAPKTRKTPAGIPISRFTLAHHSAQQEAGMARKVEMKIAIIVAGKELQAQLSGVTDGSLVTINGFLNKSVFRGQEVKIVIHAESITKE